MSDVDLIREALKWAHGCAFGDGAAQERVREALALLRGVTGLAREGDVILTAARASAVIEALDEYEVVLRRGRDHERANWVADRSDLLRLASGRPGEEQA